MILKLFKNSQGAHTHVDLSSISPDPANSCIMHHIMQKENIDLQIIVPAYNVEAYVVECICSILQNRTKYSYKVVIVNDGSTDNTREKLKQFERDSRIIIIDQENKGFSGARNAGLQTIIADYIMFVDSDDRLPDNAIEDLLNMAKLTHADIVQGSFRYFRDNTYIKKRVFPQHKNTRSIPGFAWGKVYRSELWGNIGFPEHYWFEDTVVYMVMCSLANTIDTTSNFIYEYRQNDSGITHTMRGKNKSLDSHWVTKRLLEDRVLLGIHNDGSSLEMFLYQVAMNYSRIKPLGEEVLNSMLNEDSLLLLTFFNNITTSNKVWREAEVCLRNGNYKRYAMWFDFFCGLI